ncbi:hypothetical protein J3E73DRAFT_328652, partial [Bipolaris maydis]
MTDMYMMVSSLCLSLSLFFPLVPPSFLTCLLIPFSACKRLGVDMKEERTEKRVADGGKQNTVIKGVCVCVREREREKKELL